MIVLIYFICFNYFNYFNFYFFYFFLFFIILFDSIRFDSILIYLFIYLFYLLFKVVVCFNIINRLVHVHVFEHTCMTTQHYFQCFIVSFAMKTHGNKADIILSYFLLTSALLMEINACNSVTVHCENT